MAFRYMQMLVVNSTKHGSILCVSSLPLTLLLLSERLVKPDAIFASAAPVILRLSAIPGPSPHGLLELLDYSFKGVELLEAQLDIPRSRSPGLRGLGNAPLQCMAPHSGEDLHVVSDYDLLQTWGKSVEYLWQVAMTLSVKPSVWDPLTSRLLVWRSVAGEQGSAVGEWARMVTVQNLRTVGK